jgi:phosphocarrier protein
MIQITKEGQSVDGKSIMGILMLAAEPGSQLEISAQGDDALAAVDALVELFEQGFAEDDQTLGDAAATDVAS